VTYDVGDGGGDGDGIHGLMFHLIFRANIGPLINVDKEKINRTQEGNLPFHSRNSL